MVTLQILAEIQERDFRDRNREVAPLKPADDALLLDSTTLSIDEVIAQALVYIQQKRQFRFNLFIQGRIDIYPQPRILWILMWMLLT